MEEAIFDYIEGHADELREEYAEYLHTYGTKVVNEEIDIDEINVKTFYEFAEPIAVESLNYHDDDEDYDREAERKLMEGDNEKDKSR